MSKLAINGGDKIRNTPFPRQINIGEEEKEAVLRVLDSKNLSGYRGNSSSAFMGGPEVQSLEEEICKKFNVRYAIVCNSATSGLQIASGAIGLSPGDEVIVTPWSMCCSATAPLLYNAIPIFADIEPEYFCLDPNSIESKITNRTKAIIVVDLFGQPYNTNDIQTIARRYGLYVIEDAAQAIGSYYFDEFYDIKYYSGVFGDLGVFSFTQGKILSSGEGGAIITNNSNLARKCQLIRNHAESVLSDVDETKFDMFKLRTEINNINMLGFNMRLTEIQAAIIKEQLKRLDSIKTLRNHNVLKLEEALSNDYTPIDSYPIRNYCAHSYYVHPLKWNKERSNEVDRDIYINAVKAELSGEEGRPDKPMLGLGYIKPLQTMPLFQNKKLYGRTNYPFNINKDTWNRIEYNYTLNSCPIAKRLWKEELITNMYHGLLLLDKDINDIADAFHKVWENRKELNP